MDPVVVEEAAVTSVALALSNDASPDPFVPANQNEMRISARDGILTVKPW
jgi:hypothetical protein